MLALQIYDALGVHWRFKSCGCLIKFVFKAHEACDDSEATIIVNSTSSLYELTFCYRPTVYLRLGVVEHDLQLQASPESYISSRGRY